MIFPTTSDVTYHSRKYTSQLQVFTVRWLYFLACTIKIWNGAVSIRLKSLSDSDVIGHFCLCLSSLCTCLSGVTFAPPPQVISTRHCSQWQTVLQVTQHHQPISDEFLQVAWHKPWVSLFPLCVCKPVREATWIVPAFLMCFHTIHMIITSWEYVNEFLAVHNLAKLLPRDCLYIRFI